MTGFLFDTTAAALGLAFDGMHERYLDFKFNVPHAGSLIPNVAGRIEHFVCSEKPRSTGRVFRIKVAARGSG